mmetsp:Transcript_2696/g.7448  ORF Transcript_2696/g.7448 Transcript_2696/m.7448 type:complete len:205 (+) Transcript_2696:275-889(+)
MPVEGASAMPNASPRLGSVALRVPSLFMHRVLPLPVMATATQRSQPRHPPPRSPRRSTKRGIRATLLLVLLLVSPPLETAALTMTMNAQPSSAWRHRSREHQCATTPTPIGSPPSAARRPMRRRCNRRRTARCGMRSTPSPSSPPPRAWGRCAPSALPFLPSKVVVVVGGLPRCTRMPRCRSDPRPTATLRQEDRSMRRRGYAR